MCAIVFKTPVKFLLLCHTAKRFPLGQMPTLEADDQVICQSNAICRFVARELGLYGSNSLEQAVVDQVCETLNDIGNEMIKIFFGGFDEETKVSSSFKSKQND